MDMKLRMLYLAKREPGEDMWTPVFLEALKTVGDLRIERNTAAWRDEEAAAIGRQHEVILADWGSRRLPDSLAGEPGHLRYVCNLSGTVRPFVSRSFIERGILVSNWGSHPAFRVAEGTLTLLLACLKQLIPLNDQIRAGEWGRLDPDYRGSVKHLRIGLYGLGVIGNAFIDLVRPFQPRLKAYDRFAPSWPEGVDRAESLEDLFTDIEAVVIAAALTPETRASVRANHLAALPDGGIVINTARGAILDQEALFAELETGRLRAGLDVLDTDGQDWVPENHPARSWPNLILSAHRVASSPWNRRLYEADSLSEAQQIALENLRRFREGETPHHLFDLERYDRST
jgi:phosphoglycerate dehydrogenase-like enzyme